jgi:hypothetical protein
LDRWRKAYPAIPNILATLQVCDDHYSGNPPPDGKWFFRVSRWLCKENNEEAAKRAVVDDDDSF